MPFRAALSASGAGAFLLCATAAGLFAGAAAHADEPLHATGDKTLWARKGRKMELYGHASVSQPGETLTADEIQLDLDNRLLDAKGNCVYITAGSVIFGDEMHFNMDTRTGTIVGGRVSNEKFTLSGERINKLGIGRFQTHWGEYTTCRDCPGSWSLLAEDVDMQIEGYAFLSNVVTKVRDAPAFWLPYLVVPMKTRRQTGLLFPTFSNNAQKGFQFTQPFFWAINRSADMTLGVGYYTKMGERFEWEGRYVRSGRSLGTANLYYTSDKTFTDGNNLPLRGYRWAAHLEQVQELPWGFEEKFRFNEVSDNEYPYRLGDVPWNQDLYLTSNLSLSYASSQVSGYVDFRRYRNLINTNPDQVLKKTQFDPRTVQAFPTALVTTNDQPLFDLPLAVGLSAGFSNFTRSSDAYDYDLTSWPFGKAIPSGGEPAFNAGVDPIRKAMRFSLSPVAYAAFRPFDLFALTPSVRYNTYMYTFPSSDQFKVANLYRAYPIFQADFTTQIEKVYDFPDEEDEDTPRVKHLIRPTLTASYIPLVSNFLVREDPSHPFIAANSNGIARGISGYNFDSNDLVPRDLSPNGAQYFVPLGKSLSAGFTTQLIRRNGKIDGESASYTRFFELSMGDSFNFLELQKPNPQPISRYYQSLSFAIGKFNYAHTYYYYPYSRGFRHQLIAAASYSLVSGVRQGLFSYDRSFSLSYSWNQQGLLGNFEGGTNSLAGAFNFSITDYFLPSTTISYSFVEHKVLGVGLNLLLQSPSRCWKFGLAIAFNPVTGASWTPDFALNITGSGFGGVSDLAAQTGIVK